MPQDGKRYRSLQTCLEGLHEVLMIQINRNILTCSSSNENGGFLLSLRVDDRLFAYKRRTRAAEFGGTDVSLGACLYWAAKTKPFDIRT